MGYPRRGNLPGSKTDKLIYELVNNALGDLRQGMCRLAAVESLVDTNDPKHAAVKYHIGSLNIDLMHIVNRMSNDGQIEKVVGALVGYDPSTLTFEENSDD
tara:strand:+ start:462 stop:764 length:303 start_codon:yes stop_codon:yes gene_type:complete